MLNHIIIGFDGYTQAIPFISKHKMWPLIFISGLVYLLLIAAGLYGVWLGMNSLVDWCMGTSWVQRADDIKVVAWLFKLLAVGLYVASFFFYFSIFKFILLAVASPLYGYISERTEAALTGAEYDFDLAVLIKDIIRGIRLSIRNIFKQTFWTLLLLLFSFVPVVGLVSAALMIALDAYYYGFAMLDYVCERKRMNVGESIAFIKQHKGIAVGNGLVFYLLFLIPVLGVMLGAPISAVAATLSMKEAKVL